jgi:CheY-like chemotaxis protein
MQQENTQPAEPQQTPPEGGAVSPVPEQPAVPAPEPVAAPAVPAAMPEQAANLSPEQSATPSGGAVFIVEDDTFLVRAYEVMLSSQGFNVTVVSNGQDVLEKLKAGEKPAVLLLDLMLPKLSGFEVLEQMQQDPKMKEIPVIVLSNLGQPDDIDRAKALGAKDYFVKADTPLEKVVQVIRKYTENPAATSNLGGAAPTAPESAPPTA